MKKIIALIGIGFSFAVAAHAVCTDHQHQVCLDANNARVSDCNYMGAGYECYHDSICQYYRCLQVCGSAVPDESCAV